MERIADMFDLVDTVSNTAVSVDLGHAKIALRAGADAPCWPIPQNKHVDDAAVGLLGPRMVILDRFFEEFTRHINSHGDQRAAIPPLFPTTLVETPSGFIVSTYSPKQPGAARCER